MFLKQILAKNEMTYNACNIILTCMICLYLYLTKIEILFCPTNLPNIYPCSDMGKDSSVLSFSFLDLCDFPKIDPNFHQLLWCLLFLTGFPCICLDIPPLIYFGVGSKSTYIISFFSFRSE